MTWWWCCLFHKKWFILQHEIISPFWNRKYIHRDFQFCSLYGLEQLIKSPTRVTCSTSSLIDHILTTFPERVSQQGIIDVGLFDPQLLYCTWKFSRTKVETHKQITFRSLKNYYAEAYKEALGELYFPDYENFSDVNKAYENFIQKLLTSLIS